MRKKVLFISPHLSTGGLPQYLYKKIELIKDEFKVYVVEYENISDAYVVQKNKIRSIISPNQFYTLGQNKHKLIDIITSVNPDIIHMEEIPEMFMDPAVAEKIYLKQNRKYIIIETTHDSSFDINQKRFLPDKFSFVSPYSVKQFESLGIPSELIEYPIDYKERPDREKALKELGLDPSYKHILNVGLFTPRKNQAELFEFAQKMEGYKIQFHFIGNQAENFRSYWEPIMKNKPDNCKVWGERSDVDKFYAACDMMYFASRGTENDKETNPLVIREAIAWRLPLFMYNLEVYLGIYNAYDDVYFLCGDSNKDIENIIDFLNLRKKDNIMITDKLLSCRWNGTENKIHINNISGRMLNLKIAIKDDDTNLCMYSFNANIPPGVEWWVVPIGNVHFENWPKFRRFKVEAYDSNSMELLYTSSIDVHPDAEFADDFQFDIDPFTPTWYNFFEFNHKRVYDNDIFLKNGDVVVDIGANCGIFTRWAIKNGAEKIYSVEASNKAFTSLKNTFKNDDRVVPIEFAVHRNSNEFITFFECMDNTTVSSILPEQLKMFSNDKSFVERKVETISYPDLIEKYNIGHINLLKIDIEGAEYAVFENITSEYLKQNVDEMILEFHHNNNNEMESIVQKLKDAGFTYYVYDYTSDADLYKKTQTIGNRGILLASKIEKYKIKVVHLLTLPDDIREQESVKSLKQLENYGFKYVQYVNEPYKKLPPSSFCSRPNDISMEPGHMKLTPGHYGCYLAHTTALREELSDDYDFTIICECDAIIDVPIDEFISAVYRAAKLMKNDHHPYYWASFGYREHGVASKDVDDLFAEEGHQAWAHCYMINNGFRPFFELSADTKNWDVADLWYNQIFASEHYQTKRLITKYALVIQYKGGVSLLDGIKKQDSYYNVVEEPKKLKIAQIATGVIKIPPDGWGAIERLIWHYKVEMEKLGHIVDIKYMNDDLTGYDIVHAHIANQALHLRDRGIKYVFSMNDHHTTIWGKDSPAWKQNDEAIRDSRLTFLSADYLFEQHPEHKFKLRKLSHGADTNFYLSEYRESPGGLFRKTKLLCVGNNGIIGDPSFDRKGFEYAIDAARILKCDLTIAGPSNNKNYFNTIKQSKLTGVKLEYDLNDKELQQLYATHDILVHVSSVEAGQPCLTIAEALSNGMPVVGTSVDKWEKGMLFVERDIAEVVSGIEAAKQSYKQLSDDARKFAVDNLDWSIISKKLLNYYQELV